MNKNKTLLMALAVTAVFTFVFFLSFLFSNKGTLKLKISPENTAITINKDQFTANGSFSKRLEPGQYRVTVSKNGYKTFEETISIKKRTTTEKSVQLETLEIVLAEKADYFVRAINGGTPSTDPKEYHASLKTYTTSQLFNYLKDRYYIPPPEDIPLENKQDFSEVQIIKTNIKTISGSDAEIVVYTNIQRKVGLRSLSYKIKYTLFFIKQGNAWLINRMVAE